MSSIKYYTKTVNKPTMQLITMAGNVYPPYTATKVKSLYEVKTRSYKWTLLQWREEFTALPPNIEAGVIDAIDRLHVAGVFHGDLHGDNIVFDADSEDVRIIDIDSEKSMLIDELTDDNVPEYVEFWGSENWTNKPLETAEDLLWYERNVMWRN